MTAISDPKLAGYMESSISASFGVSIATIAKNCKAYGRFKYWLNSDVSKITALLKKVQSAGVSPAFFASYECGEGYNSKWGWLNHTTRKSDPTTDALAVCDWLKSTSKNMNQNPAWIDYGNPVDFVPASVKAEGNEHYKSLKSGTIGRVVIAGTAAATWETYYPLGLKKEYNKIQDYGSPLNHQMNLIIKWGGDIGNGTSGGGDGVQLAVLPLRGNPIITQAEGGSTSHVDTFAVDLAYAGQTKVPLYAPFDMECKYVDGLSALVYQSLNPVMCADGTVSYVTYNTIHDNDFAKTKVGDIKRKGEIYAHTGDEGHATGDHTHLEASQAEYTKPWENNSNGYPHLPNATHLYNVFSSCDNVTGEKIEIGNQTSTPMPFVCVLDYEDTENSGGGSNKSNDLIHLLLCDALNGWGKF